MKLITYQRNQTISCGVLTDDAVLDIPSVWPGPNPPRSVKQILERGPDCLSRIAELAESADSFTPKEQVKLLAPVARPNKVLALAGNYSEHIKEAGLVLGLSDAPRRTTVPRPFLMPPTVVIGPDDEIPWPVYSEQIDYEIELAVVIGRGAKDISPQDATRLCSRLYHRQRCISPQRNFRKRPGQAALGRILRLAEWQVGRWFFAYGAVLAYCG